MFEHLEHWVLAGGKFAHHLDESEFVPFTV